MSTSLAQGDLERVFYLAAREHVSVATWLRRVIVPELERQLPIQNLDELACATCGHLPSEHTPNGCKHCRCPMYRPFREDA